MRLLRCLLALGLLLMAGPLQADAIEGRVSDISDGATVSVIDKAKNQHTVRLVAIDVPESRQAFGKESKRNLTALTLGKEVRIEWSSRDRYGRIVGKLVVGSPACATCTKTRDAALAQLEAGLAWWDRAQRREQSIEDQGYYEYAEFDARTRRIGLWSDAAPIPPWEWRRKHQIVARHDGPRQSVRQRNSGALSTPTEASCCGHPVAQPASNLSYLFQTDRMRHGVLMPLKPIAAPGQKIPRANPKFEPHHIVFATVGGENR